MRGRRSAPGLPTSSPTLRPKPRSSEGLASPISSNALWPLLTFALRPFIGARAVLWIHPPDIFKADAGLAAHRFHALRVGGKAAAPAFAAFAAGGFDRTPGIIRNGVGLRL